MNTINVLSHTHSYYIKGKKYLLRRLYYNRWGKIGINVRYNLLNSYFHFKNISIGNNVYIGPNANFLSSDAKINIGDNILFGPSVSIITGDHIIDILGKPIAENTDKSSGNYDADVTIEDDVWIGASVVILKGVRIGRGAVVAAGSVVNKAVLPYSIFGGVPAKMISKRFCFQDAIKHEKELYSQNNQLKEEQLLHLTNI